LKDFVEDFRLRKVRNRSRIGRIRNKNGIKNKLGFRRGGAAAPGGQPPPEPNLPPPEKMKIHRNLHTQPRKEEHVRREERA